jgi:hypothetical protein
MILYLNQQLAMIRNFNKRRQQRAWDEHVLPHGKLLEVAPNLWHVTGSLPRGHIPRNMVVFRFPNNQLLIHSAIALDKPTITDLESLGAPSWLVIPNSLHTRDAAVYAQRYPAMRVLCPQAAGRRISRRVPVDAFAEDALPPLGIGCLAPDGVRPRELVYELPLEGGTGLIFTDLLFNLRAVRGWDGWLFRKLGSTGFFGMTALGRLVFLSDKKRFREWLNAIAGRSDIRAICVGHGDPVVGIECSAKLQEAAARL